MGDDDLRCGAGAAAFAAEHTAAPATDIVEMGRRWQKAWTSHRAGSNNSVGESFGQLTDEIERLRAGLRDALGHIYWMSAASDFGPNGQAHEGWVKTRDDARRLEQLLPNASMRQPGSAAEARRAEATTPKSSGV